MIFLPSTEGKIFNCLTKYQEGFLEVWCHELPGAFSCLWTHAELSFTGSAQEHVDRLDENISCVFSQLAFNCCDSSWFPLPFLCLQQVCAISFPLFNWKCLIKLASIFFLESHTIISHTQKPRFGTAFHLLSIYASHVQTLKMQLQICGQASG